MSSEETLIQIRKDKHQQFNGGTYPLGNDGIALPFVRQTTIIIAVQTMEDMNNMNFLPTSIDPDVLEKCPKYMLRGRISFLRSSGSIAFIKLTDFTGSVQIIISKAAFPNYDKLKLLDLGDIIEVCGYTCLSKTGEKSLLAFSINLLTKSHRPLPEKFAGLADQELKYRKRYLDLMTSEESRARFTVRTYVLRAIRDFMESQNFLEVETSTLNTVASGANAKPFTTHHNALDMDLSLRIAPELYLKRLLVGGLDRVYEIGRNYRNEGIDTKHNPEFTMMESYQAYGNFKGLIEFTKRLLCHVVIYCKEHLPPQDKEYFHQWNGLNRFSWSEFREASMHGAVVDACGKAGLGIRTLGCELLCGGCVQCDIYGVEPWPTDNARRQNIDINELNRLLVQATSPGEKWAIMFEHVAEPFLVEDYQNHPVFITRYPKSICPLARANDWRTDECDRFELFVGGHELANAFQELNDPDEQALRFKEQLESGGKDPMAYDADYVEALQYGMPPAVGLGIGIDRLVMLLTNTNSIKDVILFPTLRPEK